MTYTISPNVVRNPCDIGLDGIGTIDVLHFSDIS
jgi:hypothetical protein